jgi:hypothetical protein
MFGRTSLDCALNQSFLHSQIASSSPTSSESYARRYLFPISIVIALIGWFTLGSKIGDLIPSIDISHYIYLNSFQLKVVGFDTVLSPHIQALIDARIDAQIARFGTWI